MVFGKFYKSCVSIYVPTVDLSYLSIRCGCFPDIFGDGLEKVYECYIAKFSAAYIGISKISARTLKIVILQEENSMSGKVLESTVENVLVECLDVVSDTDNNN